MMVSIYQRNQNDMGGLLLARAIASPGTPAKAESQKLFESSDLQPTLTKGSELSGIERSNNEGTAEPRRPHLAITNEGSIDLHKTHRFQTNFPFPYISTKFPAIGEGLGKQTGRVR